MSTSVTLLASAAAVFGLIIGSFLNVVIWRVPRHESLLTESRCPACGARIRPWENVPVVSWLVLRARCARCQHRISARYPVVELSTAAAFALVAGWWAASHPIPVEPGSPTVAWWLRIVALLTFAAVSIALAVIDVEHYRLPNSIVGTALIAVLLLFGGASTVTADWASLLTICAAGAAVFALYYVIAFVYPSGIGGGDVKLAAVIGVVLGAFGWSAVATGVFAGFLSGALIGLVLMTLRRATRKTGLPFGPSMLLGAWIGVVWGEELIEVYARATGIAP